MVSADNSVPLSSVLSIIEAGYCSLGLLNDVRV